jgi:hypothetical protein
MTDIIPITGNHHLILNMLLKLLIFNSVQICRRLHYLVIIVQNGVVDYKMCNSDIVKQQNRTPIQMCYGVGMLEMPCKRSKK